MTREMPSRDLTVLEPGRTPEAASLGDYLALFWRFRVALLAAAILGGATVFATSFSGPRIYESTVTLAATQSKIGDGGQPIATAAFRPMVESLTTAAAVIDEMGLDQPPHKMRPSDFLKSVISVNEVRGTNLITVKVGRADPALAAAIANSVADHAVKTARKVSASEASHARDQIKEQLDLAVGRLDVSEARLREYKQRVRVEAVRKDVETLLGGPQVPAFPKGQPVFVQDPSGGRAGLLDLLVTIGSEKARLSVIERELASRRRVDVLTKTIDSEPVLADARRQAVPGTGSTIGTQLRSESINEVYQSLDAAAATTRSNLAGLEKQRAELLGQRKLGASTLSVLDHLYAIETELSRRQVERDLAEKIYRELSEKFQEARLQVIGRSAEFVIIDPAVPADWPTSRQVARNTVVGALAGLCLGLAGVLAWEAVGRERPLPAR